MAKVTGITTTTNIDDAGGTPRDVSNDIMSFTADTPRGTVDVTGLDKSAFEKLGLRVDGQFQITGAFNTATNRLHDVLKTVTTGAVSRTVSIVYPGPATLTMEMLITSYSTPMAADGSISVSASLELQNGTAPAWT